MRFEPDIGKAASPPALPPRELGVAHSTFLKWNQSIMKIYEIYVVLMVDF